jgi:hypothetical protein
VLFFIELVIFFLKLFFVTGWQRYKNNWHILGSSSFKFRYMPEMLQAPVYFIPSIFKTEQDFFADMIRSAGNAGLSSGQLQPAEEPQRDSISISADTSPGIKHSFQHI